MPIVYLLKVITNYGRRIHIANAADVSAPDLATTHACFLPQEGRSILWRVWPLLV